MARSPTSLRRSGALTCSATRCHWRRKVLPKGRLLWISADGVRRRRWAGRRHLRARPLSILSRRQGMVDPHPQTCWGTVGSGRLLAWLLNWIRQQPQVKGAPGPVQATWQLKLVSRRMQGLHARPGWRAWLFLRPNPLCRTLLLLGPSWRPFGQLPLLQTSGGYVLL